MSEKVNTEKANEQKRLSEIVSILKKHEIIKDGISPEKLRAILEDLGPTFIKLGQIMSMRTDFLPKEYCTELEKLRADVKALTMDEVTSVIESELNRPISELFEGFQEEPLGSASIAQVHMATVKATGMKVVVKVQRPNIKEVMSKDIHLMRKAVKMLKLVPINGSIDLASVVEEMWTISQEELDFLVEASHLKEFYENNRLEHGVTCPKVDDSLTTSKVLTMEYVDGYSIGDVQSLDRDGIDRNKIGTTLTENYMKQILNDGFFHADPHPGNIRVRNGEIVWIDMGMMGRLSSKDRKLLKKAVKAVVKNDVNDLISVIISMGACGSGLNYSKMYEDVDNMLQRYCTMGMGDVDLAVFLDEMMTLISYYNVTVPKGLSMLARGIMTIEGVLAEVSPEVNIVDVASKRLASETLLEFDVKNEFTKVFNTVMQSSSKSLNIPSLIADLMESTIKGHTKVNLDLTGSEEIMNKLSKMVNKIIIGIIVASLLIGSSMICTTNMKPTVLGIPLLGFLGFAGALLMCLWLFVDVKKNK